MIVKPFALPDDPLALEAQALRDGATAHIASGAANLNLVQSEFVEGVGRHEFTGLCHDAFALKGCALPVAYLDFTIRPVHWMIADGACDLALIPDGASKAFVVFILRVKSPYKRYFVFYCASKVDPGEPFPQVGAILFDQGENPWRVPLVDQPQLDFWIDGEI